jgi:peptidoglycan endopeptidase LytF
MTRRDMIIIAVLVNVGVLAIIFMTAIGFDDDHLASNSASNEALVEASMPQPIEAFTQVHAQGPNADKTLGGDEVDRVLNMYAGQEGAHQGSSETLIVTMPAEDSFETASVTPPAPTTQPAKSPAEDDGVQQFVEVTVKKGDFLDKIARANGTTADRLIQINHLPNDRIDVGQVLKVPVSNAKKHSAGSSTTAKKTESKKETKSTAVASSKAEYYTVKSGDTPWKIAKQANVKFEDLLKLNHLDEAKAKNLKVGDKIRIR